MPRSAAARKSHPTPTRTANVALALVEAREHLAARNYAAADQALRLAELELGVPRAAIAARRERLRDMRAVTAGERASYELMALPAASTRIV